MCCFAGARLLLQEAILASASAPLGMRVQALEHVGMILAQEGDPHAGLGFLEEAYTHRCDMLADGSSSRLALDKVRASVGPARVPGGAIDGTAGCTPHGSPYVCTLRGLIVRGEHAAASLGHGHREGQARDVEPHCHDATAEPSRDLGMEDEVPGHVTMCEYQRKYGMVVAMRLLPARLCVCVCARVPVA
ncbi:MAG: hypothetical protein EOO65_00800 [Methanosarcinales archaeon]|nr:MAG: hypothetical protein EOO65_00800 [Methanosarcinales archaeon]